MEAFGIPRADIAGIINAARAEDERASPSGGLPPTEEQGDTRMDVDPIPLPSGAVAPAEKGESDLRLGSDVLR